MKHWIGWVYGVRRGWHPAPFLPAFKALAFALMTLSTASLLTACQSTSGRRSPSGAVWKAVQEQWPLTAPVYPLTGTFRVTEQEEDLSRGEISRETFAALDALKSMKLIRMDVESSKLRFPWGDPVPWGSPEYHNPAGSGLLIRIRPRRGGRKLTHSLNEQYLRLPPGTLEIFNVTRNETISRPDGEARILVFEYREHPSEVLKEFCLRMQSPSLSESGTAMVALQRMNGTDEWTLKALDRADPAGEFQTWRVAAWLSGISLPDAEFLADIVPVRTSDPENKQWENRKRPPALNHGHEAAIRAYITREVKRSEPDRRILSRSWPEGRYERTDEKTIRGASRRLQQSSTVNGGFYQGNTLNIETGKKVLTKNRLTVNNKQVIFDVFTLITNYKEQWKSFGERSTQLGSSVALHTRCLGRVVWVTSTEFAIQIDEVREYPSSPLGYRKPSRSSAAHLRAGGRWTFTKNWNGIYPKGTFNGSMQFKGLD